MSRACLPARVIKLFEISTQATAVITAKAKPVAQRPQAIIREDLNVAGMLKNHKLAQAIADVGWAEFRCQMTDKSSW